MRASEALRKPGDAARRESDGAVLIASWSGGRLCARKVYPFSSGVPFPLTYWTGEDWQPLVTAERVERLEAENDHLRNVLGKFQHLQSNHESQVATLTAELEKARSGEAWVGNEIWNDCRLPTAPLPPAEREGDAVEETIRKSTEEVQSWSPQKRSILRSSAEPTNRVPRPAVDATAPPAEPTPEEAGEEKRSNVFTLEQITLVDDIRTALEGCPHCEYDEAEGVLLDHCDGCKSEVTRLSFMLYSSGFKTAVHSTLYKDEPTPTPAPAKPEWLAKVRRKLESIDGILGGAKTSIADAARELDYLKSELAAALEQECRDAEAY